MKQVTVTISEETKVIIEKSTGMTIEAFLEKTKADILHNKYQDGKITIKEATKIMGKSEQFVTIGLQREILSFGVAFQMKSYKYSYYISPKLFYEYVGKPIIDNIENISKE